MDKTIEVIQEAYEKNILLNEETIINVADSFARFLVGDRQMALKQLQKAASSKITGIDGKGGLIDKSDPPGEAYNKLFSDLIAGFAKVMKNGK